jgi:hypothetical protein
MERAEVHGAGFTIDQIGGTIGACPSSPAAALPMLPRNAGTSITVTSAWGRSRSAPACRRTKIRGAGIAALSRQPSEGMYRRHRGYFDRARAEFETSVRG